MAKEGLTARRKCQAGAKADHSEPTIRIRRGGRLSDKSYSGDNRLVPPKSSNRRRSSAPRCRLNLSWGWRRSQGYGCSPFKKLRELGSDRSEADEGGGKISLKFSRLQVALEQSESSEELFEMFLFTKKKMKPTNHGGRLAKSQTIKADEYRRNPHKKSADNVEGSESTRRDYISAVRAHKCDE